MAMSDPSKRGLLGWLLAWPAAGAIGLGVARATHTDWPAAALPVAWLLVLTVVLRDYASRSR